MTQSECVLGGGHTTNPISAVGRCNRRHPSHHRRDIVVEANFYVKNIVSRG